MWLSLKGLLAQLNIFNASLGDVLFETPPVKGRSAHSYFQWRVKKGLDNSSLFITLKVRADAGYGLAGATTDYLSFDPPELACYLQQAVEIPGNRRLKSSPPPHNPRNPIGRPRCARAA